MCYCRHQWASLFTTDPHLITAIGAALTVLAFFVIFDGLSVALGGVVRGTGKQALAAPCTVASYYLLGLPAAAVLAFPLKLGKDECITQCMLSTSPKGVVCSFLFFLTSYIVSHDISVTTMVHVRLMTSSSDD